MQSVFASLLDGVRQLSDRAVIRVAIKTIGLTVLVFLALGALLYWGLERVSGALLADLVPEAYNDATVVFLAIFLWLLGFWLLFRIVALAVLQFYADEVVAAVEARHYPDAAGRARPLPFARDLANSLRGLLRAIALHLAALPLIVVLWPVPFGVPALLLLVNAVLLGRELTDMAWLRHESEIAANPVPRGERLLLGGAIAGIMLVPFANLAAPIVGAAAGTHLVHRANARHRERETANA